MVECWNADSVQRPAFREVHMFLQRKNMGYNPADEHRTPSRTATPYSWFSRPGRIATRTQKAVTIDDAKQMMEAISDSQ